MKKFFIGLLLAVAFFVVPCFCVKAPSTASAASELQLDSSEIVEEVSDSKFFKEKVIPFAIEMVVNAGLIISSLAAFLKTFKKKETTLVEATASNIATTKENKELKKKLEGAVSALNKATALIERQNEMLKLAIMNSPALIANGTAKKVKEVYGYEEREETAHANEKEDKT